MSAYSLRQDLPSLVGEMSASRVSASNVEAGQPLCTGTEAATPSLHTVLQSPRVRAWVPPHLIESLYKRA